MPRLMLTDELWSKLKPIMLDHNIYDKEELRQTTEGILYRMRVGCCWRDLPKTFGNWNSVYRRFNDWCRSEKLMSIFKSLIIDPDLEWKMIDGTIVKAHQHSAGCNKSQASGIGKSVAGNTSKIHMVVDSHGSPVEFEITAGQVHDSVPAPGLVERLPKGGAIIADRAYDSHYLRWVIKDRNETPIIPRKKNSKIGNEDMDWITYKERHKVENLFARLKHFRSVATRFDKLNRNFVGTVALACAFYWLRL